LNIEHPTSNVCIRSKAVSAPFPASHRTPRRFATFDATLQLHRARLFFREKSYPWKSPQDDLAAAEKLIHACGYHRRDQELADAKKAILGSS